MDYFIWSSLRDTLLLWIVISYDIMCQYWIKFWQRMWNNFEGVWVHVLENENLGFIRCIPKFHLPVHIIKCWEDFNFNFTRWTAHTDGESVERNWAPLNLLARSAKEMGPGAWRDLLEDHISDMNWKKVVGMRKSLFWSLNVLSRAVVQLAYFSIGFGRQYKNGRSSASKNKTSNSSLLLIF
jgi:hypothetical protein